MRMLVISPVVDCAVGCSYCHAYRIISRNYKGSERSMSFESFRVVMEKIPDDIHLNFGGFAEAWLNPECTKMVMNLVENKRKHISAFTTLKGMKIGDAESLRFVQWGHFCIHLPDSSMNLEETEEYLEILAMMSKAKNVNYACLGKISQKVERIVGKRPIIKPDSRTCCIGNGAVERNGAVSCSGSGKDADHNILLPDGRVVLCCQDTSMNHVLGNLLTQDYEDLFSSEEYLRVKQGMNGNGKILCHYCIYSTQL